MIQYTNCKINIGLNILSRRDDGFHDIETLFYPVNFLNDAVEILASNDEHDHVYVYGLEINDPEENNLCFKAVKLLRQHFSFPNVTIHLYKNVPMGAGLGGGSADATATLMLVNQLYNLEIPQSLMLNFASKLGSDCAFFVQSTPQIGKGKGEVLSPVHINLSGKYLLIVKPNIHVSTADAYRNVSSNNNRIPISKNIQLPIEEWKHVIENDFELSIFKAYPQIAELKRNLYQHGAIYAQMSGSGAACYGIFDTLPLPIEIPNDWLMFVGKL